MFFDEHPEGRYGFIASNGKYLSASGKLLDNSDKTCQFLLGFHDDQISLRDEAGNYLSCVGANAKLQVNKQKVTKDELFQLTDSEPQFVITDNRDRYASVRQGVEIKCDQSTVTDAERFQLELDPKGKASFKSNRSTYWSLGADNTISASAEKKGEKEQFSVVYGGATVQFVAANGKYVTVKSNGGLVANGAGKEPESIFTLVIINRPDLVLRGQFGFIGLKGASGRVEVNKSRPVSFFFLFVCLFVFDGGSGSGCCLLLFLMVMVVVGDDGCCSLCLFSFHIFFSFNYILCVVVTVSMIWSLNLLSPLSGNLQAGVQEGRLLAQQRRQVLDRRPRWSCLHVSRSRHLLS